MRKGLLAALLIGCLGFGSATVLADIQSHRRAAEQLASLLQMEQLLQQTHEQVLNVQIQANPDLNPYRDVLLQFLKERLSWDNLKDELLDLYTENFTEAELQELVTFYATETGQKSVRLMPEILRRAGEIGLRRVQEQLPELERRLQEKADTAQ